MVHSLSESYSVYSPVTISAVESTPDLLNIHLCYYPLPPLWSIQSNGGLVNYSPIQGTGPSKPSGYLEKPEDLALETHSLSACACRIHEIFFNQDQKAEYKQ